MESFFLSETAKYLFLLFAGTAAVPDHYVLSTEVRWGGCLCGRTGGLL